jgi:hypothetical protein
LLAVAVLVLTSVGLAACVPPPPPPPPPGTLGFDACTAPSSTTMSTWVQTSPYRIAGIYIGGANRGCSQPNLTATWVTGVSGQGWRFIPIYVGLQAPCSGLAVQTMSYDLSTASSQGVAAANDAADKAQAVGLPPGIGNPIYFDMEAYNRDPATPEGQACITAVLTFVHAWVDILHSRGYVAGFYSSGASGITDVVNALKNNLGYHVPDQMWFAHSNDVASVWGDPYMPDNLWTDHQRHHQYHGGHPETWGGLTINIDNDVSDGATAIP